MGAVAFTKANPANSPFSLSFGGQPTPVVDNRRVVRGSIVLSASYATGGDTLSPAALGLREVTGLFVDASQVLTNVSGLSVELTGTKGAPKVQVYDANSTEVANGTNLSARASIPVMILGS